VPVDEAAGEWTVLAAGSEVPKEFEHYVTNPKAFVVESAPADDQGEEPEVGPYDGWNLKALKAELKQRELPQTGNHAELLARLTADDAEIVESAPADDQGEE
jgi:hypothetical protein